MTKRYLTRQEQTRVFEAINASYARGRTAGFKEAKKRSLAICRKADNDSATIEWVEDQIRELQP